LPQEDVMKKTFKVFACVSDKGKLLDCSRKKMWAEDGADGLVKARRATLTVDLPAPKAKRVKK
jgi:hypothetical protein